MSTKSEDYTRIKTEMKFQDIQQKTVNNLRKISQVTASLKLRNCLTGDTVHNLKKWQLRMLMKMVNQFQVTQQKMTNNLRKIFGVTVYWRQLSIKMVMSTHLQEESDTSTNANANSSTNSAPTQHQRQLRHQRSSTNSKTSISAS